MPQPAQVNALPDATSQAYIDAWGRITAEQERIAADPFRFRQQRRLREMQTAIEATVQQLDDDVADDFVRNVLPKAYAFGATDGAAAINSDWVWSQIHAEAVEELVQSAFNDLLTATRNVRESTKDLVRRVARSEALQATIGGRTATQAAADMRKILNEAGIYAMRYADGSRHGLAEYAEMVQRTKTATAYNLGTVNGSQPCQWYEIFDGPDCGLSFHYDPTLANGLIVPRGDTFKYVIAHPNCRRSFGPRPDILDAKQASETAGSTLPEQLAAQRAADARRLAGQQRAARRRSSQAGRNRLEQRQARQQARAERVGQPISSPVRTADLTEEELRALRDYTGADFAQVNGALRQSRVGDLDPEVQAKIPRIDSAMAKSTLDEDLTVYRGATFSRNNLRAMDEWFENPGKLRGDLVGREMTDPAFLSTSADIAQGRRFIRDASGLDVDVGDRSFLMEIKAGRGTRAINLAQEGFARQDEAEWLLNRGTRLRVTAVEDPKLVGGKWQPGKVFLETVDTPPGRLVDVGDVGTLTRRADDLKAEIADFERKLKAAPGGGARARIKRKMEPLQDEWKRTIGQVDDLNHPVPAQFADDVAKRNAVNNVTREITGARTDLNQIYAKASPATREMLERRLQRLELRRADLEGVPIGRVEPPPPPVVPPPIKPKKYGDFRDDLPDFSDLPTLDEIKKAHFGWTNKTAEKELIRLKLAKLPTVEQLRKAHVGWTTKVAQKRLDELTAHITGGKPPVRPPVPKTIKPKLAPDPKPTGVTPPATGGKFLTGKIQDRIEQVRLKYEKDLFDPNVADDILKHEYNILKGDYPADLDVKFLQRWAKADPKLASQMRALELGPDGEWSLATRFTGRDLAVLADHLGSNTGWMTYADYQAMDNMRSILAPYVRKAVGQEVVSPERTFKLAGYALRDLDALAREAPEWAGRHSDIFRADVGGRFKAYGTKSYSERQLRKALLDYRPDDAWQRYVNDDLMPSVLKRARAVKEAGGVSKEAIEGMLRKGNKAWDSITTRRVFGAPAAIDRSADLVGGQVNKAIKWYTEFMDGDVASTWATNVANPGRVELNRQGRAYYQVSGNRVSLEKGGQARVAVHEYGHSFEYHGGKKGIGWGGSVQDDVADFRYYRGTEKGDGRTTQIYKHLPDEFGYKDEFINHYMGKIYNDGKSTEIISMGMEEMYASPKRLYDRDPEYFWLIVGILKGDLVGPA